MSGAAQTEGRLVIASLVVALEGLCYEHGRHRTPDEARVCSQVACRDAGVSWQRALDYLTLDTTEEHRVVP